MNPYFFGDSRHPLYGVHHPPRTRTAGERGAVLCPPFGQEYMRSHRAFRQLANLLSRRGLHVLRFDYSGTGDSAGASDQVNLDRWHEDVGSAIEELQEAAGLKTVSLVGLRLGAAIAARVASARKDVDRLVLWDPVLRGEAYLEEITAAAGIRTVPEEATAGILGFPLTPALRSAIREVDLPALGTPPSLSTLMVTGTPRADLDTWAAALASQGRPVTSECIPSPGDWNELDYFGSVLVPQAVIRAIVDWLGAEPAHA